MRKIKDELRAEYKKKRKNMSDKFLLDREIQKTFLESDIYNNAQSILCYCALMDEISTDEIIKKAFEDKKPLLFRGVLMQTEIWSFMLYIPCRICHKALIISVSLRTPVPYSIILKTV